MSTAPDSDQKRYLPVFLTRIKGLLVISSTALYFYYLAAQLERFAPAGQLGPAFWPKMSLLLLMAGCFIKAIEIFGEERQQLSKKEEAPLLPPVNLPRLILMIILIIFPVVAMEIIGFLLANLLFLILLLHLTGLKRKIPLLLISFLGNIILLYIFVRIVYLPLPRGQGIFNDLTIFLYRIFHLI